ncbi:site-specific integrase [Alteromonas sp. K632G]|uniref:site-specific integrase n=1 Tax=Alteromonas sp. K632G TaxID=2820757 RepID=UPI001FCBBAF7|nr:site-specific integrase [Alteromonas sp. K632G]
MVHKVERQLIDIEMGLVDCTVGELIQKYLDAKQNSNKPIGRTAFYTLQNIAKSTFGKMLVSKVNANDVVSFCLERKKSDSSPSPSTLSVDVSCIRKVFRVGKSMFGINVDDRPIVNAYPALHDLKLISRSNERERRLEENEFEILLDALKLKQQHHCCLIPYHDLFLISILTCCRISEVCKLKWRDLDIKQKTILVRDRKNPNGSIGNHCILPLLGDALGIILRQHQTDERIFPFNARSITSGFRRTRQKLNIPDLRYHDLRREGASRLIEMGYSVEETARVTGHRDLNVLWRVYVNIRPQHFLERKAV